MKPITQSRWIRGVNATFGIFSQPDGTVPRLSNLMLTKRGSLATCFGSQLLARTNLPGNILQGTAPMWLELFLYQLLGAGTTLGTRQIYGLLHAYNSSNGNYEVLFVALPLLNENYPTVNPKTSPNPVYDFGGNLGLVSIDSAVGGVGGGGGGFNQGTFRTALQYPAVPQILQYNSIMVLCLGSGTNPYVSSGVGGTTTALVNNTFSAQYPNWQANVSWIQGSLIQATIGALHYVFKAIQGGVSSTSGPPPFASVLNSTVTDNQVIWQNVGQVTASPVPRGAAHGINYAGSLWLANTSPSLTTDGLDSPSAVRMSDINNYSSWNPLNSANLGLGDGTEVTGFASFTIAELGISPTGSLIVFKQFSTYQIIGIFGSTNLTIQPLQTDLGNIAPRSIQFLPSFGIMRLSHLGFALTDGVRDKLTSEELRPYLFGGTVDDVDISPVDWNFAWFSKAAQTAHPPMYVCACPVIGGVGLQPLSGVSVSRVSIATSFGGQTWYCRVSTFGVTNVETAVSPEFGPFVLDPLNGLQVTLPAYPPGATTYSIYVYQKSANGQPISGAVLNSSAAPPATVTIQNFGSFLPGNPPSGLAGALTRLFCFDLILRAWAIVDLPWPISVLKQFRMHGSVPITVSGGYSDQTVRRILSNDTDWDGQPITWAVRSREVFGEGGSQELFMRRMIVRGFGQTSARTMSITPTYDGADDPLQSVGTTVQVTNMGVNQFEVRLDLERIARNVHVMLVGQGQVEIESMEYEVEPCEVGAPIVIA